jgi:hypothetical protein
MTIYISNPGKKGHCAVFIFPDVFTRPPWAMAFHHVRDGTRDRGRETRAAELAMGPKSPISLVGRVFQLRCNGLGLGLFIHNI